MFDMITVSLKIHQNSSIFEKMSTIKHPHKLHTHQSHDGTLPSHDLTNLVVKGVISVLVFESQNKFI